MTWTARANVAWVFAAVACVAAPAAVHASPPATSQPATPVASGPTVAIERYEVSVGDKIGATIDGFHARIVTLVTCGNSAIRGSADCAMGASASRELSPDGPLATAFTVEAPPVPCPCVIRVFSPGNDEVAVVPFTLLGHPSGPPIESPRQNLRLAANIVANPATAGAWTSFKAMVGGPATYDVTITVRNMSTITVSEITARAWVGRGIDDAIREIELPSVGALAAGETWAQTARVELPAATWGDVVWQAAVTGAGPTVTTAETTENTPWLLYILIGILIIDVLVLAVRFVIRIARRSKQQGDVESVDRPRADRGDGRPRRRPLLRTRRLTFGLGHAHEGPVTLASQRVALSRRSDSMESRSARQAASFESARAGRYPCSMI